MAIVLVTIDFKLMKQKLMEKLRLSAQIIDTREINSPGAFTIKLYGFLFYRKGEKLRRNF